MKISSLLGIKEISGTGTKPSKLLSPGLYTGLELEVEGISRRIRELMENPAGWAVKGDGSLRNGGLEYVLDRPSIGKNLETKIESLETFLQNLTVNQKRPPFYNWRTSLHVHLNFSDKTFAELFSFVMVYLIFERLLMRYCGEERTENIFCVPIYKSTQYQGLLEDFFDKGNFRYTEDHKYCALNLHCLRSFGSVELRMHQGTHDSGDIVRWLNILYSMVNKSKEILESNQIRDLPVLVSTEGLFDFGVDTFGVYWPYLIRGLTREEVNNDMIEGLRLAQEYIYMYNLPIREGV